MGEEKERTGRFERQALPLMEAHRLLMEQAVQGGSEKVPLAQAAGRVLAEEIRASHPFPAFDRSAMDGYAIRAADTERCQDGESLTLRIVEEIPCGSVGTVPIVSGTAARIMTGAPIPEGADAVVMLEMTETPETGGKDGGGGTVRIQVRAERGQHITRRGLELEEGEAVLLPGTDIGPGEIAMLAALGIPEVPVIRRPRVAVFATGSELLDAGVPLEPGKIRDSNSPMLTALLSQCGAEAVPLGVIADDLEQARSRIQMALELYDLVLTTGGVSVGDYDIMGDLVRESGAGMLFNKVAMRPGSVTTAAVRGGKLLLALSGNPGACYVGFQLLARPLIGRMLGRREPDLPEWKAVLAEDYRKKGNFTRLVRARLEAREGRLYAVPSGIDESSVTVTIMKSDCLIVVPEDETRLAAGSEVTVIRLP
ncbi:molybdopterin molybdotransferase MoeA [Paenibacillus spiritus]|uniref:Molybdopterin molybdenumtransferase n=1 Tax=Paenibacillus spiritus TaxID=2496557 RepID=A0A5J5GEV7_9BACL|nr:gephyrin-like molybdotransferase Glp [Paenibacillus spiritus]KAA9006557.1 molybdopterin molybdotransferase MoeA [Paenibacillus spiritus]